MSLTTTQLQALRTDCTVTRASTVYQGKTLLTRWNESDEAPVGFYNAVASPAVPLWRPDVSVDSMKAAIVWADYVALTPNGTLKQAAYLALTQGIMVDTTVQGIRDAFTAIFGAGSASLTALAALAKRSGTNLEVLLAGAADGGAQVSQVYGDILTSADIAAARIA